MLPVLLRSRPPPLQNATERNGVRYPEVLRGPRCPILRKQFVIRADLFPNVEGKLAVGLISAAFLSVHV